MKGSLRVGGVLVASAAAAATFLAVNSALAARSRRRQIERGELRQLRSIWTMAQGFRIHARAAAGPAAGTLPVVLVHGFGISSSYFLPTAERLATEFRVFAPDLPGHGRSESPPEPLDVPQLADSLIAWMGALGLQRACLVGHSMGCQVAVDAAVRYPERVDRLVLIGPTPDPGGRNTAEQVRRLLAGGRYERVSLNRLVIADYARMGPRLLPEFRFMLNDPIEDKLAKVAAPVMLVRGSHDLLAPQPWFDEAAARVGAERVAVIEGWGHAVQYSAAGQLTEAVVPFLRAASQCDGGLQDRM